MERKKIVLITGSSGFIGSCLVNKLSSRYQVVGLDRKVANQKIPGVDYHAIDMTSAENISQTLGNIKQVHGNHIHSVIHLVAYYSFSGKEDDRYKSITVEGTKLLMQSLKQQFNLKQFIFSSSMLLYAPVKKGDKITDESPLAPSWPYPMSKVAAENILKAEHEEIPVVNLRIAGVYDDYCHSPTISNQIIRIYERWATSVPFPGTPDHGQSFIHLDDLVDLISRLINKQESLGAFETFVLGEEKTMSYRELQECIGKILYLRPWPVIKIPKALAKSGAKLMENIPFMREPFIKPWMIEHADENYAVDITRLKKTVEWNPKRNLRDTLPIMLKHLQHQPEKWYSINKITPPFYRSLQFIGSEQERNKILAAIMTVFLGLWLMANPFTFGGIESGEFWSELVIGLMVSLFATLSLIPTIAWFRWINALLGIVLMFSPLVFESTAAAYSNDTLLGGLIMLASVYTPSQAGDLADSAIPPGWSYNPSTAGQRIPIMFLAFAGFLLARYLAAFQLGHIESVWEPFFGDGTVKILNSDVSKAFPVSDAGLGALTYLLDIIAASLGGRDRWRSQPWAVILFGIMIIPAGVTSIVLVMLQPINVNAWCTICLLTAFIMLMMVPFALDEVLASIQFLKRRKMANAPFWRTFWLGGQDIESAEIPKLRPQGSLAHLFICSAIGIWLMFTPWIMNIQGFAASNTYILAALIITFSFIAFSEVGRPVRLINIPLGAWLGVSTWFLAPISVLAQWHSLIVGVIIILLSFPRGKISQHYGTSDPIVHWTPLKKIKYD